MYVFNGDGTMQQANPDAGDAHGSDSEGKDIFVTEGGHIKGKWVEVIAARATNQFAGRVEVLYDITSAAISIPARKIVRSFDAAVTQRPLPPPRLSLKASGSNFREGS